MVAAAGDFGAIAVFQIDDAARHLQQGRRVGCRIIAVIRKAQQQRRAFASDDDPLRLGLAQHGKRVSALQLPDGSPRGGEEIRIPFQFRRNEVGDDLGIGIRGEFVAFGLQAGTQGFVILDDAVMHNGQPGRNVRVGVTFAGNAMRRPAGVGDAGLAAGGERVGLCRQLGDPADRTQTLQATGIDQRQSCRVITPILQPP